MKLVKDRYVTQLDRIPSIFIKYQELFGTVDEKLGFNLTAHVFKNGVIIKKWYSRNDFHCELEDKVLFRYDGKIFREGKEVIVTEK